MEHPEPLQGVVDGRRRYFFMEAVKDIAEGYRMTPGNVSVSLDRTRKKLKEHLEKNGYM